VQAPIYLSNHRNPRLFWWVLLLLVLLVLGQRLRAQCLQLDVVLVGDYSSSVAGHERFVLDAFAAFAERFTLAENGVRVGVVTFDSYGRTRLGLSGDRDSVRQALGGLRGERADGSGTDLVVGLVAAQQLLLADRPEARKLVVLVSDGAHNGAESPEEASELLQAQGILVAGVLVRDGSSQTRLMDRISTPGMYVETRYENLVEALQKLDVCL